MFLFLSTVAGCSSGGMGDPACSAASDGFISLECAASLLVDKQDNIHLYQWPLPLKPGDRLEEGIPEGDEENPPKVLTLEHDSWFFFADLEPGALWNHPTEFILVNRVSGEVTRHRRNSYPKINDLALFSTPEERSETMVRIPGFSYPDSIWMQLNTQALDPNKIAALSFAEPTSLEKHIPPNFSPDDPLAKQNPKWDDETEAEYQERLKGMFETMQSDAETDAELDKCPVPDCEGVAAKFALIIDGGRVGGPIKDFGEYLRKQGVNTRVVSAETAEPANPQSATDFPTSLKNIEAAFDWLAGNVSNCCDEVLIVISAHGAKNGVLEMNPEQTVRDVGNPDPAATKKIGRPDGGFLSTAQLKKYLNKLKTCRVKVQILSCYSGRHLELGINKIPPETTGCMCRVIAVSSSARQTSGIGGVTTFMEKYRETNSFAEAYKHYKKEWSKYPGKTDRYLMTPQVQATDCVLCKDQDEDGILSGLELEKNYSDPENPDTDGDGLCDSCEKTHETNPRASDSDKDGIPDGEEVERGTNPLDSDSDGDGLSDRYEKLAETDPLKPDTDGDGLTDGEEALERRTLPTNPDTDGDGKSDGKEVREGTDPNDPQS